MPFFNFLPFRITGYLHYSERKGSFWNTISLMVKLGVMFRHAISLLLYPCVFSFPSLTSLFHVPYHEFSYHLVAFAYFCICTQLYIILIIKFKAHKQLQKTSLLCSNPTICMGRPPFYLVSHEDIYLWIFYTIIDWT